MDVLVHGSSRPASSPHQLPLQQMNTAYLASEQNRAAYHMLKAPSAHRSTIALHIKKFSLIMLLACAAVQQYRVSFGEATRDLCALAAVPAIGLPNRQLLHPLLSAVHIADKDWVVQVGQLAAGVAAVQALPIVHKLDGGQVCAHSVAEDLKQAGQGRFWVGAQGHLFKQQSPSTSAA